MQFKYALEEIDQVAKDIIAFCEQKTILFYGPMGVGKTTLIKSIIKNLGSTDTISSPTFSIVNEYQETNGSPIYHFDFYRINDESELEQLGLEDYFDKDQWTFIEWPEKINSFLPNHSHTAKLGSTNNEKRTLTVS
ncbi:MAG TPA: tRNA (adenosine(37)-N6)-threonylcarbamoyltransferase complex ATPase subunit type 1 TsaE [Leeuwenhoekiella sp.]|nr:tRNA (adenosine(37)-N6)-threonylcarbamoyltransferase complex ATPase subunit type 1 TsaE [Leeuwenhoekiella sp.]